MKKFFLISLILIVIILTGCGSNEEVKELAIKENALLNQLELIAGEVKNSYSLWESGEISRKQLAEELSVNYAKVQKIRNEWVNAKSGLSREAKNNALFWKLATIDALCRNVQTFIINATQGYPSSVVESSHGPLTDEELAACYDAEMVKNYNRRLDKLQLELSRLVN